MELHLLVHALDRTGPPMLALAFARWFSATRPTDRLAVVAFRGGPLLSDFVALCPTVVLVDPDEPWDHAAVDPLRARALERRAAAVGRPDAMLAVSVAAGQCLASLPRPLAPLATWVVEQGPDLHWLDDLPLISRSTTRWLAGSSGTRDELLERVGDQPVHIAAEFVDAGTPNDTTVAHCRASLGPPDDGLLVVGAGIATFRKAPDLFIEAAQDSRRRGHDDRFVWIGGQDDAWFPHLVAEVGRLDSSVRFLGNVSEIAPWLAAADVLLHTARLDAFPLVALHAAAASTPVVGFTGAGGLVEMFDSAALGAPYPDLGGLVDQLDRLRDVRLRRRIADEQRSRVQGSFATSVAAPSVQEHLDTMLSGATTGASPE